MFGIVYGERPHLFTTEHRTYQCHPTRLKQHHTHYTQAITIKAKVYNVAKKNAPRLGSIFNL